MGPTLKSEPEHQTMMEEGQNLVGMEIDEDDLENSEDDEEEIV